MQSKEPFYDTFRSFVLVCCRSEYCNFANILSFILNFAKVFFLFFLFALKYYERLRFCFEQRIFDLENNWISFFFSSSTIKVSNNTKIHTVEWLLGCLSAHIKEIVKRGKNDRSQLTHRHIFERTNKQTIKFNGSFIPLTDFWLKLVVECHKTVTNIRICAIDLRIKLSKSRRYNLNG